VNVKAQHGQHHGRQQANNQKPRSTHGAFSIEALAVTWPERHSRS
jgi:hypothetical protein